jgi:5-methylthioadenosine/S-adenosylhomocysteine deaminase
MTSTRTWFPLTGAVASGAARRAAAPKARGPVDPLTGPKQALSGRVVTMNDAFKVLPDGIVYIEHGGIVAVQERAKPAPAGFAGVPVVDSGGTIFPGLMELHNHLSYNALPLWSPVPKRFRHRDQWSIHKDYRPNISGPMTVIGEHRGASGQPEHLPALVRYVECKCLLGGVTTTQGLMLASNAGIRRYYRGLIRNVEQTDDPALAEAQGRIADVDAKDARHFLTRLKKEDSCFLLHLSEGVTDPARPGDSIARKHFLALEIARGEWALNDVFTGIHAAGLLPEDFDVLASKGASIVWSPFSNLLLYGGTARVEAARASGVTIGLGSDWSPTGSKNLLGELKVALLYSRHALGGLFTARDLVAMATRDAARILKWDGALGTIASGARADLLVVDGSTGDPYDALIRAKETDIHLVMINGVARYGTPVLMAPLAPEDQTIKVAGQLRRLFLKQDTADPDVAPVSLANATTALTHAFRDIAKLAKALERPKPAASRRSALDAPAHPVWSLALDEIQDCGEDLRPRLPFAGPRDFTGPRRAVAKAAAIAAPLSAILKPIRLDAITVADDEQFLDSVEQQPNLPSPIKSGLRALY